MVARRHREILCPGSHARGRPRSLGLARRWRPRPRLRRRQAHGARCRGRPGRDRCPARRPLDRRGNRVRRRPQEGRPLSAGCVLMAGTEGERRPTEARPPCMEALARLPIFLALAGKRAVVAGSGPAVAWKAELLSAAGAAVDVFAESPCEELRDLGSNPADWGTLAQHARSAPSPLAGEGWGGGWRGTIALHPRAWRAEDFPGAAVAVAGFDEEADAQAFAGAARAAGVPVNVIDKPAHCDFSFGAIVNRSPLVIGISTDGAAPVFGQAIRAKLAALLPRGFARWAEAARRWRPRVLALALSFRERRRFKLGADRL